MSDTKLWEEIEAEAVRMDAGTGYSLGALLTHVEGACEMIREAEVENEGDVRSARRDDLVTLAAWALAALRQHDADPMAPLDD